MADVLAAIDKIDTRAAVAAFAEELGGSAGDRVQAVTYEWYCDGSSAADFAAGRTFVAGPRALEVCTWK